MKCFAAANNITLSARTAKVHHRLPNTAKSTAAVMQINNCNDFVMANLTGVPGNNTAHTPGGNHRPKPSSGPAR